MEVDFDGSTKKQAHINSTYVALKENLRIRERLAYSGIICAWQRGTLEPSYRKLASSTQCFRGMLQGPTCDMRRITESCMNNTTHVANDTGAKSDQK